MYHDLVQPPSIFAAKKETAPSKSTPLWGGQKGAKGITNLLKCKEYGRKKEVFHGLPRSNRSYRTSHRRYPHTHFLDGGLSR